MSLRKEIIRLAHENPELREHLLPLVTEKTAGQKGLWSDILTMLLPRGWKLGGGDLFSVNSVEKIKGKEYVLVLRIESNDMLDMEIIHEEEDEYGGSVTSNYDVPNMFKYSLRQLQKEVSDFVKGVV